MLVALPRGEPIASVMAIGSQAFGECVEEIRVEVGQKIMGLFLLHLGFPLRCRVASCVASQAMLSAIVQVVIGRTVSLLGWLKK